MLDNVDERRIDDTPPDGTSYDVRTRSTRMTVLASNRMRSNQSSKQRKRSIIAIHVGSNTAGRHSMGATVDLQSSRRRGGAAIQMSRHFIDSSRQTATEAVQFNVETETLFNIYDCGSILCISCRMSTT